MPGNPDDPEQFIVVWPNTLSDLARKLDEHAANYQDLVRGELEDLGQFLVDKVRANTPKNRGRLADSTKYRVVTNGQPEELGLEIYQDAKSTGRRGKGARSYPYWYTVHHGTKPLGRLKRIFPEPLNLVPWVRAVKGVRDPVQAKKEAYAIARNIFIKGLKPNPYLINTMNESRSRIEETATALGKAILIDLEDLPNVRQHTRDEDSFA